MTTTRAAAMQQRSRRPSRAGPPRLRPGARPAPVAAGRAMKAALGRLLRVRRPAQPRHQRRQALTAPAAGRALARRWAGAAPVGEEGRRERVRRRARGGACCHEVTGPEVWSRLLRNFHLAGRLPPLSSIACDRIQAQHMRCGARRGLRRRAPAPRPRPASGCPLIGWSPLTRTAARASSRAATQAAAAPRRAPGPALTGMTPWGTARRSRAACAAAFCRTTPRSRGQGRG